MKYILPLIIVFIICNSCKKKDECADREYKPLHPLIVQSIPYTDGQEVSFVTNNQGSFSSRVQRKFQMLQPDSPKICEEYLEVNLIDNGTNFQFVQFLDRGYGSVDSVVQFTISPYKNNKSDIIQFVVRANGDLHSFLFNGESVFHDTLTVNNQLYNHILELFWKERTDPQQISRLFYNTDFGIIRYETKDGLVGERVFKH